MNSLSTSTHGNMYNIIIYYYTQVLHHLKHVCFILMEKMSLSYDVASGSEITPCNKIDKPLVVYRLARNVMTSITTLRT